MNNKVFTVKNIEKIYLSLGMNCNFNCKYCYQKNDKNKFLYNEYNGISNDVIEYIKNIASQKENGITLAFWGGEPFLYFDLIKDIVDKLKDYNVKYSTVSNGSVLTKEIVEFCNHYDFLVGISHDGKNTYLTRGFDVLNNDKKLTLIKSINKMSIVTVFSSFNYDLLETAEYCYSKLNKKVPINLEWLHCDDNTDESLYNFDQELVKESFYKFLSKVKQDILDGIYTERIDTIHSFLHQVGTSRTKVKIPNCMQMRKCINIDLIGNITACHPYGKLGTIFDDHLFLIKKYDEKYNIAFEFEDCKICKWKYQCRAGCPLEYPCKGKSLMCNIKRMFFEMIYDFLEEQIIVN